MNELFHTIKVVFKSRRTKLLIGLQAGLILVVCITYFLHSRAMVPQGDDDSLTRFDLKSAQIIIASENLKPDKPLSCYQGTYTSLDLKVSNYSSFDLISGLDPSAARRVNLGYRLYETRTSPVLQEGPRYLFKTPVEKSIDPDTPTTRNVSLKIKCPDVPGDYLVSVEIVQEGRAWQSDVHKPERYINKHPLKTLSLGDQSTLSENYQNFPKDKLPETTPVIRDKIKVIYESFKIAKRLLDVTTVSHSREPYPIRISEAGSNYPMVWSRDMNTIQVAYDLLKIKPSPQTHWAELFFEKQDPKSGSIPDWVALNQPWEGQWSDKNDVQSDQELWLIDSVLSALRNGTLKSEWLNMKTNRKQHSEALQDAMSWVLKNRQDQETGCIWNAHTADWGDVALKGADGKTSTKRSENSLRVCGLFLQSLFLKVSQSYLSLNDTYPELLSGELQQKLKAAQKTIRQFLVSKLWIPEPGYFRMHIHLGDEKRFPDDAKNDELKFALGGHVMAFEAGILPKNALKKIAEKILNLKNEYQISTIASVLLPPYASSTFENPIMKYFEYQNGGQWDWYGARATLLIEAAFPGRGVDAIHEIALKIKKNGTFHEWDHPDGSPGAGPHFRAGAAAYITAYHGLLKKETFAKNHRTKKQTKLKIF